MSLVRCPACGAENASGSQFCSSCARRLDERTGERVAEQRATAVAAQTTTVRWIAVLAGSGVVLVIAVLVILLVFVVR